MRVITTIGQVSLVLAIVVIAVSFSWASNHPAQGYVPGQLPYSYGEPGGLTNPEWDYGELTFVPAYPAPDALSDLEKYMVAGTQDSADGQPLISWWVDVMMIVNLYYSVKGTIPNVLDAQAVADAFQRDVNDGDLAYWMDILKSPLTGEYPVLNAESFSPGNMYVHALTTDEMSWFADKEQIYYEHWFGGKAIIDGPVYYFRMYGQNDVIKNMITYFGK